MKKLSIVLLGLLVAASSVLVGCNGGGSGSNNKIGNSEQDLEIVLWQSGYGRDYFDAIIDAYKAKHPEINIGLTASAAKDCTPLYTTPKTNTVDLYFTSFPEYGSVVTYDANGDGTKEEILEDLNSLLDMKADGETKTLREKFGDNILNAVTNSEGKIYSLPWYQSLCGLIYNADEFQSNGWDLPRTTGELIDLAEIIQTSGKTPFIHYADYWKYMYEAWVAQYEGLSVYQDMWKGIYTDANGDKYPNDYRFITESQGRYESYKVLSEILGPKGNVYAASNSLDHTRSQTYFIGGKAAMMPGGSWVENEMKDAASGFNYGIMKTPVISAIIGVLPDRSVANESELCALIDAIDNNSDALEGAGYSVTQADYDRVKQARNMFYISGQADVLLPAYSTAKEVAKDFLRFYYSDEAMQIGITKAGMLATVQKDSGEFDYSKNSAFIKDCYAKSKSSTIVITSLVEKLMYAGGISQLFKYDPVRYLTYSTNASDFKSLDAYWNGMEKKYWEENWNQILTNAGLQSV